MIVSKELVAWWVEHYSLRLHVLFNRKNNNNNNNNRDDVDNNFFKKSIILFLSFTGGDRFMQQFYQDLIILIRYFNNPDLFVIFTANPRWKKVTDALFPNQTYIDRPDIIVRVFRVRLKRLIHFIRVEAAFGPYRAYVY